MDMTFISASKLKKNVYFISGKAANQIYDFFTSRDEWRSHEWNMYFFHLERWNKKHIHDKNLNILYLFGRLHA